MESFKINRVNSEDWISVDVFISRCSFGWNKTKLVLKKQVINGNIIPRYSVIYTISDNVHFDKVLNRCSVIGNDVNELIKYVAIQKLRETKKLNNEKRN